MITEFFLSKQFERWLIPLQEHRLNYTPIQVFKHSIVEMSSQIQELITCFFFNDMIPKLIISSTKMFSKNNVSTWIGFF